MARHLRITGLVQGVGYRAALETLANALGLRGWVRNRRDGSVEAMVAGTDDAVDRLVVWARDGPPGSRVDHVDIIAVDDALVQDGSFRRRPTE